MDIVLKCRIINIVRSHWETECYPKAGLILYERIDRKNRPLWVADILCATHGYITPISQVEDIIAFATNPILWGDGSITKRPEAHDFFNVARTAMNQSTNEDILRKPTLLLAENAAKITYNAYGYEAPFDHDAGWCIVENVLDLKKAVNNPEFTVKIWEALCQEKYITLDQPIRCNPYCKVCSMLDSFDIPGV